MADDDTDTDGDTLELSADSAKSSPFVGPNLDDMIKDATPSSYNRDKAIKDVADIQRKETAASGAAADSIISDAQKNKALVRSKYEGIGPASDIPDWNADKERADRIKSPMENFGSMGSMFAILASAFTKTPMLNALNGAAAAMTAARDSDQKGYDDAFEAFKKNTDIAFKRHDIERQSYLDATDLMKTDLSAGEAAYKANALRFGDQKKLAMVENGMLPEAIDMDIKLNQAKLGAAKAADAIWQYGLQKQAYELNPKSQDPDPLVRRQAVLEAKDGASDENVKAYRAWEQNWRDKHNGDGPGPDESQKALVGYGIISQKVSAAAEDSQALKARADKIQATANSDGTFPTEWEARLQAKQELKDATASALTRGKVDSIDNLKEKALADHPEWNGVIPPAIEARLNSGYTPMGAGALQAAAERYVKTGTLPPNVGRSAAGQALTADILDKADDIIQERGINREDMAKNWQKFKAGGTAITRFESGPQSNAIRALNVAVEHLGTLDELATALKNGNSIAINAVRQKIAEQTGSPVPTNVEAITPIIGAEVMKALGVAGAGTAEERANIARTFSVAKSPAQLEGASNVVKKLLAAQVNGYRQQYIASTGLTGDNFDKMILPGTLAQMQKAQEKGASSSESPSVVQGTVKDGVGGKKYRFKGGDSTNKDNWTLVE